MFSTFEKVVHGQSPIGGMDGTWGLRRNYWFLLNSMTECATKLPIKPKDVSANPSLCGTLGRSGMEGFAKRLVQFAQTKGDWVVFLPEEVDASTQDLDFWVECGWLTKHGGCYYFTMGFVMLMLSRSSK